MPHRFHPVLSAWFADRFGDPTDVQKRAWPLIAEGAHTLVAAPTGSGKTLAALLPLLDRLVREKLEGGRATAERGVRILYVTPLKALNNDIRRHLFDFLYEWRAAAERMGVPWPDIAVAVRTGDTTRGERAAMVRRPPDVLVTTPESLFILLTSRKARDILRAVRHVVADEIHDLAAGERGAHFSVTLERLSELCGRPPQRIGVSATVHPVRRVARFLGGWEEGADERYKPRPVAIVESSMERPLEVAVTVPPYGMLAQKGKADVWTPLVEEILRHVPERGTALVFANNRRLCERLSARLNEARGEGFCRSHHGSVSRERRLETEALLREGKLRCLVATSSLELGIDIGAVERRAADRFAGHRRLGHPAVRTIRARGGRRQQRRDDRPHPGAPAGGGGAGRADRPQGDGADPAAPPSGGGARPTDRGRRGGRGAGRGRAVPDDWPQRRFSRLSAGTL